MIGLEVEEIRSSNRDYWIWARAPCGQRIPEDSGQRRALRIKQLKEGKLKSGKWLIFTNPENVDEVWGKIREATEAEKLGTSAKVRTAMPDPREPPEWRKSRVICVYTHDWTDQEDVMRVREPIPRPPLKIKKHKPLKLGCWRLPMR